MKIFPSSKTFVVFDCAHTDSHNDFNRELMLKLKNNGSIILFSWNNSYNSLRDSFITVIRKKYLIFITSNPFFSRIIFLFNTLLNSFYIRCCLGRNKKRFILIGHEIISLGICFFLFPKGMYLIHHMQIDELQSSLKRFFFSLYKNRFVHVVMSDYIKDYLINHHNIDIKNIKVVPHPLYNSFAHSFKLQTIDRKFVALNYSGDESVIASLIQYDSMITSFADNGCMLVIKSKSFEYSSLGLRVFKGFLPKDEYKNLYSSSDCVLSMLNSSFKYRISGTVVDAISCGKPVIALRSACTDYFQSIFPNGIIVCDDFESLIKAIINFRVDLQFPYYSNNSIIKYQKEYESKVFESFE